MKEKPQPFVAGMKLRAAALRPWLVLAVVLGGWFAVVRPAVAVNLLNPVPVFSGNQFNTVQSMGSERTSVPVGQDEMVNAWREDSSNLRRTVYLQPIAGLHVLVAAAVNLQNCSGGLCDLELKATCFDGAGIRCTDQGMNWTNALSGPPIKVSASNPEYTLYVSPNGQAIWLSYKTKETTCTATSGSDVVDNYTLHEAKIKKLTWDVSAPLLWSSDPAKGSIERTVKAATCTASPSSSTASEVGVAVEFLNGNPDTERVFGIVTDTIGFTRTVKVVATDTFAAASPTWDYATALTSSVSVRPTGFNTGVMPSLPKYVLFPVGQGTGQRPGAISVIPRAESEWFNPNTCQNQPGQTLNYHVRSGSSWFGGNTYNPGFRPYQFNFVAHGDCFPGLGAGSQGAYPMDFNVAVAPRSDTESYVVIAVKPGIDSGNTFYGEPSLHLFNCRATTFSMTCASDDAQGAPSHKELQYIIGGNVRRTSVPAVGFIGLRAYIAFKDESGQMAIMQETDPNGHRFVTVSNNASWDWEKLLPVTADGAGTVNHSGNARTISMPSYIPSGAITLNSGLPPVVWNMVGSMRIVFSASIGGSSAGGKPSGPVKGFGWASTFGWLSLNCASVPGGTCTPPTTTTPGSLYGVGINLANSLAPTDAFFSPSSANTYPLGGYAYSDNAGFLSFERSDSVYPCDGTPTCGDADSRTNSNPRGDPPGQAYYLSQANSYPYDPIAKYDKTFQHLYGWGRFLNLCNYDSISKCKDSAGGWVRLRGFWTDPDPAHQRVSTLGLAYTAGDTQLRLVLNGGNSIIYSANNFGIGSIGGENFYFCRSGDFLLPVRQVPDAVYCPAAVNRWATNDFADILPLQKSYAAGTTTVFNVTGQEYGVDAYWTGSNYEFSGWAWSEEYGWIRFNPLIFVGYAWMETLYGNIYSGGYIQIPDPVDPTGARVQTCGVGGASPCYAATYRIETDGSINGLTYVGTQQSVPGASSGATSIVPTPIFGAELTDDPANLLKLLQKNTSTGYPFPNVNPSTTVYRNLLGKIDLQALFADVGFLASYVNVDVGPPEPADSREVNVYVNRLGNRVYDMQSTSASNPNWSASELLVHDLDADTGVNDVHYVLSPSPVGAESPSQNGLRSQVVHIPGNFTVDGASGTVQSTGGVGPYTVTLTPAVTGSFPVCPAAASPSFNGCALVFNPGPSERYATYTGYNGTTKVLSGVTAIGAAFDPAIYVGREVRWVWHLPYKQNERLAQTTTIVVDGNLEIQYNILATNPSGAAAAATKVTDTPTIAFIVKGNVLIQPQVTKVSGAFVVLGRDSTLDPDTSFTGTNGGTFFTSSDLASCDENSEAKLCTPLVIEGMLFARQFAFQRYGALSLKEPGEQVSLDERLFLNPPPGLADVTKVLANPERTRP